MLFILLITLTYTVRQVVPYKDDSTYDEIIDAAIKSEAPIYEMERTSQSMDSVYRETIE